MAASHLSERASLRLRLGDEVHSLDRPRTVLGRSRSADIRLRDDSVSRLHAAIFWQGRTLLVEDLGSSNGTSVNGQGVVVPRALTAGDRVRFGSLRGVIEEGPAASARAPRETSRVTSWNVADRVLGPPASFVWRLASLVVDIAALALASCLAFSPLLVLLLAQRLGIMSGPPTDVIQARAVAAGISGALWVIVVLVYVIHGWACRGGSPGMLLLGLRLLDWRYRSPIGYPRAWLRLVAGLVTVLTLGLGLLASLVRRDHRALHDILAGTLVVHRLPVAQSPGRK